MNLIETIFVPNLSQAIGATAILSGDPATPGTRDLQFVNQAVNRALVGLHIRGEQITIDAL